MQYTPNYHLPIYEPDDPTAWLTIFNNAMTAIDAAIAQAKATDPAVLTSLQTLTTKAQNAENSINTINGNLTTLNGYVPDDTQYTFTSTIDVNLLGCNNIMSIGPLHLVSMIYNVNDADVPAGTNFITTNSPDQAWNMILAYAPEEIIRVYNNKNTGWVNERPLKVGQYFIIGFWWT